MKVLKTFFVAFAALALFPSLAAAQAGMRELPPGKWWENRRIINELKLSPEQQNEIDAVWNEGRRRLIDQKAEMEKAQLDMSDALGADTVDEAAALKAFDRMQAARTALERSTLLMRIRIKNALSPEQQVRLEEIAKRLRPDRNVVRPNPQRPGIQPPRNPPPAP